MPQVGDRIDDKYELTRLIGEGGMGTVFEASHIRLRKKKVAIKFLHPEISSDSEALIRFKREAEATAAIDHPGIIDVQDIGQLDDASPFMVLEFLQGQSLAELLRSPSPTSGERPLPMDFVVYVGCKVLSALSAAHQENIIHRDLKPDNIFLVDVGSERPEVKLLDFGIARFKGQNVEASTLTSTGTVIGTPFYLSPEQAQGHKDIDHRSDIFSMGSILYQCLTGERPFNGPNYPRLIVQLCTELPPPMNYYVNGIPEKLQATVFKALQKDRSLRHQTAAELFGELVEFGNQAELHTVIPPRGATLNNPPTMAVHSGASASIPAQNVSTPSLVPTGAGSSTPNAITLQPSTGARWPMIVLLLSSVTALVVAIIAISVTVYVVSKDDSPPRPIGAKVDEAAAPQDVAIPTEEAQEQEDSGVETEEPTKTASTQPDTEAPSTRVEHRRAGSEDENGRDSDGGTTKTSSPQASIDENDGGALDQTEPTKEASRTKRPRVDPDDRPRENRPRENRPRQQETTPRTPTYGGTPSYGREVTPSSNYGREIR